MKPQHLIFTASLSPFWRLPISTFHGDPPQQRYWDPSVKQYRKTPRTAEDHERLRRAEEKLSRKHSSKK